MVRQNRYYVKSVVRQNRWFSQDTTSRFLTGISKMVNTEPAATPQQKIVKSGNYITTSTTTMLLLPHIPHYTGGSNACAAAHPLFCHISRVIVTVQYVIWHTQPEVCPWTLWDHYKKNLSSNCWVDNPRPCPTSNCSSITLCTATSPSSPISWK